MATKILIVEDDNALQEMYDLKFKQNNWQMERASSAEEAWEKILAEKFNLILLDIILPEMDGFGLLKNIKQVNNPNQTTPVILLTNLGDKDSVKKGEELGVENYLIKAHFSPQEVVDKIKEVLRS